MKEKNPKNQTFNYTWWLSQAYSQLLAAHSAEFSYCEVRNRGSYKTHRYRKYIPAKLDSLLMSIPSNDNIEVRILGYPLNVIWYTHIKLDSLFIQKSVIKVIRNPQNNILKNIWKANRVKPNLEELLKH